MLNQTIHTVLPEVIVNLVVDLPMNAGLPNYLIEAIAKKPFRNESVHYEPMNIINIRGFQSSTSGCHIFNAKDQRNFTLAAYFSIAMDKKNELIYMPRMLSLMEPYVVGFDRVKLHFINQSVPPWHSLIYACNCILVGLVIENDLELKGSENQINSNSTKRIGLYSNAPKGHCVGLGFIRGVDPVAGKFQIITPVPFKIIQKVNLFVRGTFDMPMNLLQVNNT